MALKQSVHSLLVLNRVIKLRVLSQTKYVFLGFFFVLHRVRVSNPQRLTCIQILVEYSPPPPPMDKFHRKQSLGRGLTTSLY